MLTTAPSTLSPGDLRIWENKVPFWATGTDSLMAHLLGAAAGLLDPLLDLLLLLGAHKRLEPRLDVQRAVLAQLLRTNRIL